MSCLEFLKDVSSGVLDELIRCAFANIHLACRDRNNHWLYCMTQTNSLGSLGSWQNVRASIRLRGGILQITPPGVPNTAGILGC